MIILASRSPQRRALSASIGVDFRVLVSSADEGPDPMENARAKAEAVAARAGMPAGGVVVACDTEVVVDGAPLGKPADAAEARLMLRGLSGRAHEVHSALVVMDAGGRRERMAVTRVHMRTIPDPMLEWYVGTGEWRERAGGYAIQGAGAALVERVDGDYTAVVGLPLAALADALTAAGVAPWDRTQTQDEAQ